MLALDRPIVVLDTETTGTEPKSDRVVQIGLVKVYPGGEEKEWQTLVNPMSPIPPELTEIHGITDEQVREAPTFGQIAGILRAGITDCDIAGYKIGFDLQFLIAEYRRLGQVAPVWGDVVDAGKIFHKMSRRTLTVAAKHYLNEDFVGAHDALNDARMTLRILQKQTEVHDIPNNPRDLAEWLDTPEGNYLDADGKIAWRFGIACINFGNKHRNTPLHLVPKGYLNWMLENDFSPRVKKIIQEALQGIYPKKELP